jgi:ParB-like chromosome segregation protein Spo0J
VSFGKGRGGAAPRVRLDDNLGSYDVARDGRSGHGRLQEVRLDRIVPSRFQVRLVFPEAEIDRLAGSVLANGLIHEPRARPHPDRPGWIELMPGEMRIRALHRLVERGEADGVLSRDADGNWLVQVRLEPTDDERADAMVFGENFDRVDLSPWEWAVGFQRRRDRLRERGLPSTVRDVAAAMHKKAYQTVGEYLQVADGLTLEVLVGAGLVTGAEPEHARLARLSLAALLRAARATSRGPMAGVQCLLSELRRSGDAAAAELIARREQALAGAATGRERAGLQLNIRQALAEVTPRNAVHYLRRLAPAVGVLAQRAASASVEERCAIADELEAVAAALRRRGQRGSSPAR